MPKGTYVFTGNYFPGEHTPKIEIETPEEHGEDRRGKPYWQLTIHDAHGDATPFRSYDGDTEHVFRNIEGHLYRLISSTMVNEQTPDIKAKIAEINDARPKPTQ